MLFTQPKNIRMIQSGDDIAGLAGWNRILGSRVRITDDGRGDENLA